MCAWLQSWKHRAEWLCASCLRGGCTSHLRDGLSWDEPNINLQRKNHSETSPAFLPDALRWDWESLEALHLIKTEHVCINVQRTHWVFERIMYGTPSCCDMGAPWIHKPSLKEPKNPLSWTRQADWGCVLRFIRKITKIGKGEDITHKYS